MIFALTVDLIDKTDGEIHVSHTFWGETEEECRQTMAKHAEACDIFGPALAEGRVMETLDELEDDEWPEAPHDVTVEAEEGEQE
jgi:hypothetical protein